MKSFVGLSHRKTTSDSNRAAAIFLSSDSQYDADHVTSSFISGLLREHFNSYSYCFLLGGACFLGCASCLVSLWCQSKVPGCATCLPNARHALLRLRPPSQRRQHLLGHQFVCLRRSPPPHASQVSQFCNACHSSAGPGVLATGQLARQTAQMPSLGLALPPDIGKSRLSVNLSSGPSFRQPVRTLSPRDRLWSRGKQDGIICRLGLD
ncbi:unnamed protein product [Protopolystoma xenopodis]|uniref:Uncharacterized protein n=1 Tax=Protopolystoma xenopodis TaxID=117903 RepID=A0A448XKI7_9PLAT|nr:unnamed protein product [Protopolystoma xenopodis]